MLALVLVSSCASKAISVDYDSTKTSPSDWYPIPSDAPASVTYTEFEIPRHAPYVAEDSAQQPAKLEVLAIEDSIGNMSLSFNRPLTATWELIDLAFADMAVVLKDKNRSEYRFELIPDQRSGNWFSRLFSSSGDELSLVLIPHEQDTLVFVEGESEEVPSSPQAKQTLQQLLSYFDARKPQ